MVCYDITMATFLARTAVARNWQRHCIKRRNYGSEYDRVNATWIDYYATWITIHAAGGGLLGFIGGAYDAMTKAHANNAHIVDASLSVTGMGIYTSVLGAGCGTVIGAMGPIPYVMGGIYYMTKPKN
jgi:hypothetical protein